MWNVVTPLPVGTSLLEYRILRILGQGSFGTTYLCRDQHLDKDFVVKEFTPGHLVFRTQSGSVQPITSPLKERFATSLSDFLQEARRLAKFNHRNIAKVVRYFEALNTAYFVMEHEFGISLRERLSIDAEISETEIGTVILPLCHGLAELHSLGILHRDIKPENVIIRQDGSPVLIDFGAAIDFHNRSYGGFPVIVTPHYAPVEQHHLNGHQGPWTDIYALGATAYEMVAGVPPVPSIDRANGTQMLPASDVGRGRYGDRLLGLIDHCLALDWRERPADLDHVIRRLEASQDNDFAAILEVIPSKMAYHFINWAKPNSGLHIDEFVAFLVCFPVADLSWRIGKGSADKATSLRLLRLIPPRVAAECKSALVEKGFRGQRRDLGARLMMSRFDEYAAAYLLDRQEKEWRYQNTLSRISRNCIAPSHKGDIPGFCDLMEDVIDRARGRVKRGFNKMFRSVVYRMTEKGWIREVIDPLEDR